MFSYTKMKMWIMILRYFVVIGLVASQEFIDLKDDSVCPLNQTFITLDVNQAYYIAEIKPGDHQVPRDCSILMKVSNNSDKDWGLMVYIESMYLRGNEVDGCVDYIQFGKDDIVPFLTLVRSEKICGEVNRWFFDVDNGKMNIWMHFDLDGPKYYREKFAVVNLRMIITPYRKRKTYGFSECHSPGHFLQNSFFCDNIVNCATDLDQKGPRDENERTCVTTTTTERPSTTTQQPTFPTIQTTYINIGFESEDLRLGTIISMSLGVLVGLGCCMVCCVKRCSRMSLPPTPTSDPDECHEMRLSGLPTGHHQQRMVSRGGGANVPDPDRYGGSALSGGSYSHLPGSADLEEGGEYLPPRGNTPPPAYNEIFPGDYQHPVAKQLSSNLGSKDERLASTDV